MKSKKSKKVKSVQNYDIVIVGGGISGLYSAYKLINKYKNINILLLESSDRLGGRILTIKENDYSYEAGAGRFHENQYRIMNLIKELKLDKKIVPIGDEIKFIPYPKDKYIDDTYFHKILDNKGIINEIIELKKDNLITDQELIDNSFLEILEKKLKYKYPNIKEIFEDTYEYWSEIAVMNAYDAFNLITEDFINDHQYYVLNGGLTQIIDKLEDRIKKRVKIIKNYKVDKIVKDNTTNTIFTINNKYTTNNLILALPKHALLGIDYFKNNNKINKLLNYVEETPLLRIYAQYPKNIINYHSWFDKFPTKIITGSKLKYIIPVDYSKGLIMISYTDGKYTDYWMNSISDNNLDKKLELELKKTFPDIEIPKAEWIKPCYWQYGAGYWKKGINSEEHLDNIIQPNPKESLYICNENYSKHQTWMEGSLQSVNLVLNKIKLD